MYVAAPGGTTAVYGTGQGGYFVTERYCGIISLLSESPSHTSPSGRVIESRPLACLSPRRLARGLSHLTTRVHTRAAQLDCSSHSASSSASARSTSASVGRRQPRPRPWSCPTSREAGTRSSRSPCSTHSSPCSTRSSRSPTTSSSFFICMQASVGAIVRRTRLESYLSLGDCLPVRRSVR